MSLEFFHTHGNRKDKMCKFCYSTKNYLHRLANPEKYMLQRAKVRARELNVDFDITEDDITIPNLCPLLGIKLEVCTKREGSGRTSDNSPSLDRIIPYKGYTKGNVKVISFLANMIKNKATPEQIKLLAENIDVYTTS